MVANAHLPYEDTLEHNFAKIELLARGIRLIASAIGYIHGNLAIFIAQIILILVRLIAQSFDQLFDRDAIGIGI
ncbi:MAG: hypothetical protein ACPGVJ_05015 [Mangrovicoccus sp.]